MNYISVLEDSTFFTSGITAPGATTPPPPPTRKKLEKKRERNNNKLIKIQMIKKEPAYCDLKCIDKITLQNEITCEN